MNCCCRVAWFHKTMAKWHAQLRAGKKRHANCCRLSRLLSTTPVVDIYWRSEKVRGAFIIVFFLRIAHFCEIIKTQNRYAMVKVKKKIIFVKLKTRESLFFFWKTRKWGRVKYSTFTISSENDQSKIREKIVLKINFLQVKNIQCFIIFPL